MHKQRITQPRMTSRALAVQCGARLQIKAAYFKQKKYAALCHAWTLDLLPLLLTLQLFDRSLGQNYLANKDLLNRIASAAKLTPSQAVIEVGPGRGLLTKYLVDQQASVTAVEKDSRLIASLTKEFPQVHRSRESLQHLILQNTSILHIRASALRISQFALHLSDAYSQMSHIIYYVLCVECYVR